MSGNGLTIQSVRYPQAFDPGQASGIVAWWNPALATGIGSSGFALAASKGGSSYTLTQTTIAQQPGVVSINGKNCFRFAVSSGPIASSAVHIGATTKLYLFYWRRWPNGVTGTTNIISHDAGAGNRGFLNRIVSGATSRMYVSTDGTATPEDRFNPPNSSAQFVEHVFDGTLSDVALRLKKYTDLVEDAAVIEGSIGATYFDPLATIMVANVPTDVFDLGIFGFGTSIPTTEERQAIRTYGALA